MRLLLAAYINSANESLRDALTKEFPLCVEIIK